MASGAALGYGYGTYSQGLGLYRYSVLPCFNSGEPISLEQYSTVLMPPGTKVLVYPDKNNYRIEPFNEQNQLPENGNMDQKALQPETSYDP